MKLQERYVRMGFAKYLALFGCVIFGGLFFVVSLARYAVIGVPLQISNVFVCFLISQFVGLCFGTIMWFSAFARHR